MMIPDASATVAHLVDQPEGWGEHARRRFAGEELHAPHLLDLEVANALGRLVFAGALTATRAGQALDLYLDLDLVRYAHGLLLQGVDAAPQPHRLRRDLRSPG